MDTLSDNNYTRNEDFVVPDFCREVAASSSRLAAALTENDFKDGEKDSPVQLIGVRNFCSILPIDEQLDDFDHQRMASLSSLLLLGKSSKSNEDSRLEYFEQDTKLQRVSLAYEKLTSMPKILIDELGPTTQILDISHNELKDLVFLKHFPNLTTLICDHNNIDENTNIPFLPKLELLWMNHCKIKCLIPWAKKLHISCPNLEYLSLMGNPAAPSYLNGSNFYEYLQYRLYLISLFGRLTHLDDREVTKDQRTEAEKVYQKPLMHRLVKKTHSSFPDSLRQMSDQITNALVHGSSSSTVPKEKNVVI